MQALVGGLVAVLHWVGAAGEGTAAGAVLLALDDGPSVLTVEQEREKAAKPGSDFKECATGCPTMVVVPAGKFMMGSPESEKGRSMSDEGPQHEVTIPKPFAVSKTEVTFAQWDACVARRLYEGAGCTLGPWQAAGDQRQLGRCQAVRRLVVPDHRQGISIVHGGGVGVRGAGWSQTRFSFGDDQAQLDEYAWYNANSGKQTHPVGRKGPMLRPLRHARQRR